VGAGDDRWSRAQRIAFGDDVWDGLTPDGRDAPTDLRHLVDTVLAELGRPGPPSSADTTDHLDRPQLVHGDIAGNVLLDRDGIPLVIDMSPQWRPPLWAEAVCVLDAVLWQGAERSALAAWRTGRHRRAMLRAVLFRVLSDSPADVAACRRVVDHD